MNFFKWYWGKLKESNRRFVEISRKFEEDKRKAREMNPFAKKCPRCDSTNLNQVKANAISGGLRGIGRAGLAIAFPVTIFFGRQQKSKPLNVCKDCGFSW